MVKTESQKNIHYQIHLGQYSLQLQQLKKKKRKFININLKLGN